MEKNARIIKRLLFGFRGKGIVGLLDGWIDRWLLSA